MTIAGLLSYQVSQVGRACILDLDSGALALTEQTPGNSRDIFHTGDSLFIVRELLTQRRSGHASGTVFDYDTRNKTLTRTDSAANNQCQWNRQWRSDEETKLSERVSVVISCDSHVSTRVGKHSSARVRWKIWITYPQNETGL